MAAGHRRPEPGQRWICRAFGGDQGFTVERVESGVVYMENGSSFQIEEWENPLDAYDKPRWFARDEWLKL